MVNMRAILPARFFATTKKMPLSFKLRTQLRLPEYLKENYWWAYLHPKGLNVFERQWIVNMILWGNFTRLRDCALEEFTQTAPKSALQVACVYGNFTEKLAQQLPTAKIDVVDVAPIQLENLSKKVADFRNVSIHHQDSADLQFADNTYDSVIVFFLLHEQPLEVRQKTIKEAIRVAKPGGKVVFVDYHNPSKVNPLRYVMIPVLAQLEPFAMDMWTHKLEAWLPKVSHVHKETYFGGLYQKVVCTK